MNCHILKTWPEPFEAIWRGNKTAEFRKDDRGYAVGDGLMLREYDPETGQYTGRRATARVTCVTKGFGIPEGYAMLSLRDVTLCTQGHSFWMNYQ